MTETDCPRSVLAESEHCRLAHCACGIVHLTMGPLTLRLEPEVLEALADTCTRAARALRQTRGTSAGGEPLRGFPH